MVNIKIAQRAVAAGLSGLMAFGAAAPAALATGIDWKGFEYVKSSSSDDGDYWKRIGGDNRYETMKKIVEAYNEIGDTVRATIMGDVVTRKAAWNYHSTAVLASGDNFPDALAANGLAGYLTNENLVAGAIRNTNDAVPVILTKAGSLSSDAKDLLEHMQVQNVIIMGGTAAVSQGVEDALNNMGIGTQRVAGKDRQETSLKALQRINGNWEGRKGTYDLIIATGDNFADALSISPYAYRMGTPVILTKKDGTLTDEQVAAIKKNDKIREIVIVGGTSAVSDAVMGQIGTLRNNGQSVVFHRIAGADRYETSTKIAEFEIATWWDYMLSAPGKNDFYKGSIWSALGVDNGFSFNRAVVATGENFPDALVGGQLAGGFGYDVEDFKTWFPAPLLLTKDGNNQAERLISNQLAKNSVAVGVDAYASYWDWQDELRGLYPVTSAEFKSLDKQWFTWYGVSEKDFANYPFYISIQALKDWDPTAYTTTVTKYATITYKVDQTTGTPIFTITSQSSDVTNANISATGLSITYNGVTDTYDADEMKTLVGEDWDAWSTAEHTVKIKYTTDEVVDNTEIDSDDIIRYVGHIDEFYGIVLGGKKAVSEDKMDDLDDVVEAASTSWNSYLPVDTVNYFSKGRGVNLDYSRLDFVSRVGNLYTFEVRGLYDGSLVVYDADANTWTLV